MIDIEEEFQILMREAIDRVNAKLAAGTYDTWEAQDLISKIDNILDHGDTSRCGNVCPQGHTDPDCGWSPSMGYHCS